MIWRTATAVALTSLLSCAHGLQPCKECAPGFVCHRVELPGGLVNTQCFRHCRKDRDCAESEHCNCDEDACTVHSGGIPSEVCVAAERRTTDPEAQDLFPQAGEKRSCSTCAPDDFCVDVGHGATAVYKCFKQCATTADCPAPQVCNCGTEQNGFCSDDYSQGMCIERPAAPPSSGASH